ncbi:5-oxoprolinase subunit PxpB [Hyphomicrobium sp. CS1BSMeth3]|uniref:5-oxoprolinase subunit PxpB n=1 Tax=Hyphomicrobium sp. CS1BSMeth3 TaxID=1892844 RepID=UPI000930263F|nr:5-oxoprolinase subunit PxpB [Hyphomicrobium sp. CS1BSMeth3]
MPRKELAVAPRFLPSGDTSLVVEFGDRMDRHLSALVLNLCRRVEAAGIAGVSEAVPTFRSLMVHYDPLVVRARELQALLVPLIDDLQAEALVGQRWYFPTCYEGDDFAPDLADVAAAAGLDPAEVVATHVAIEHLVYMIGFLPGQAYMGDLPKTLALPRRTSPRIKVSAGSVAIAIGQTTIYPFDSPGGWHIIGRSAVPLFDTRREKAALLSPGDTVQFVSVSREVFEDMQAARADGTFDIDTLKVFE